MSLNLTLKVWRQSDADASGSLKTYKAKDIDEGSSFLEMLDEVNEGLIESGEEPIAFDSDCREGICGACSMVINGHAHGPDPQTTVCQLHMRSFSDGDTITIEPWRAAAFPVIRDLVVDRSKFDDVINAGGYISSNCGAAPDANATLVARDVADRSMDAAACIGCGACVAACPNGSAMLFTAAKLSHLGELPQGQPERYRRTLSMVTAMDEAGFGNCTNHYECEAVCPKAINRDVITRMNRDFFKASFK